MSFWDIFIIILNFAGALAIFLFGMKLMSEGLQKAAGSKMRATLAKITNNPVRGVLTGTVLTTAVQSSSATTVMVVSFVNAGLLSLTGAVSVIMGANIGTTATAWIITLFGLGDNTGMFSLPMTVAAISLIFTFSKRNGMKSIGEFIVGLSLLLVGMAYLQAAMPDLSKYPEFLKGIASASQYGFWSILLFIIIGALLTCLVQASAAMMAITLVMCYNGWIGFDMAVALVMGQNIGTTITANIAAMVANSAGKKAALAHLVFNVITVILTLIAFPWLMKLIDQITISVVGCSPYADSSEPNYNREAIPMALSFFHTFFNVAGTLILIWFIPQIVKIVNFLIKTPPEETQDQFNLKYISGSWVNLSEVNILSAKKEIENFSDTLLKMYDLLPSLRQLRGEEFEKQFERIRNNEANTDRMEMEISKFLTQLSAGDLSYHGSQRVSSMLRIIDNLESIGDSIYQVAMLRKTKMQDAVHFDQNLNDNLSHMTELVRKALEVMDSNLKGKYENIDLQAAYDAENAINDYRDQLRKQHLDALRLGVYGYAIGSAYSGLYALYEKMGDYIINVSEAIDNSRKVAENKIELGIS